MSDNGWLDLLKSMPVASSHCHHQVAEHHTKLTLDGIIGCSYAGWCGYQPGTTPEQRGAYLDHLQTNTYHVWLSHAIAELYGLGEISVEGWEAQSAAIAAANADPGYHLRLLRERSRYLFAVQDTYWDPGSDLGEPELFRPTYRINDWVMAPRVGALDHNSNSPWNDPTFAPATLEEYLDALEAAIREAVGRGCVAIKSALAYDRPVSFDNPDLVAARRAFAPRDRVEGAVPLQRADQLAFGDVAMRRICETAAALGVPFQVHLGLGILNGSRAMNFEPLISLFPQVTFDLFHCGYPWLDDVAGLLHNYHNVVADFCWVPLISTTAAVRALHEYLDVAHSADRIIWGDDTQTSEEAYGGLLAWEQVVARVLQERVRDGLCSVAQAERMAAKLMHGNAEALFGG
jgi:uncharacterized protein